MVSKKIYILVSLILVAFTGYSQHFPRTTIIEQDTCIVFTISQAKQMALWNTQKKECLENSILLNNELSLMDSIITFNELKIRDLKLIENSYQQIIVEKNDLKRLCEVEKVDYQVEIKRQKRLKWLYAGIGVLATSFTTYLYIQK